MSVNDNGIQDNDINKNIDKTARIFHVLNISFISKK